MSEVKNEEGTRGVCGGGGGPAVVSEPKQGEESNNRESEGGGRVPGAESKQRK